jgi:ABC-type oligopeptide transport system substrate-binding subunit
MKTEKRMICFIVSAALLIVTLWFTSCGAATAEAGAERKPCYHVTVYSPGIVDGSYAARRYPKYTITVDTFEDLVPTDIYSRERDYQLLQIPLGDGRFELVSTSLVEIEYY